MSPVAYAQEPQSVEVFTAPRLTHFHRFVISDLFKKQALEHNWDGYGSPPPSRAVVDRAVSITTMLNFDDTVQAAVIALEGGGVQVDCARGSRELHLSFFPEGSVEYLKLQDGRALCEGVLLSIDQLYELESWID